VYLPEEKSGSQKADSDETAVDGEIVPSSDKSIVRAKVVRQLDPQFSEEARSAKYQGTINLAMVVDKTGQTRNIRIMRPIGMGLDQKAVEAVSRWQFEPALKDGEPVAMGPIQVQVDFHLY
jgi:TonB family protein